MSQPERVGEIQNNSDPSHWKHVAGERNVADGVSRGITVQELEDGRWKKGPAFLSYQKKNDHRNQHQLEKIYEKTTQNVEK